MPQRLEIICPAGTLAALQIAVDEGADAVYVGFQDETNARNFPGLNFDDTSLQEGVAYAHAQQCKIFMAINTYAEAGRQWVWHQAVDRAVKHGVDALIMADIGLLAYASKKYPHIRLHLSVQASASHIASIHFYIKHFNIQRVVLPRVLTLHEIADLNARLPIETEIFAFGGMCPMAEGRCSLSSYITGKSPNRHGVCSPASHVTYKQDEMGLCMQLAGYTINRFSPFEHAGYPTLCKGRFKANAQVDYLFEDPVSLNILHQIPEVVQSGVRAIKIEGRQRGKAYVREVVRTFRKAVDNFYHGRSNTTLHLHTMSEGQKNTTGAYDRQWR